MEYLSTAEVAKKWGITARRVQILCKEGRVEGAVYKGIWLIPDDAKKPEDPRKVQNKGLQKQQHDNRSDLSLDTLIIQVGYRRYFTVYEQILKEIAQPYYKDNYPNDGQRFVAWYLRNIHNLDTYETKECITDGAGDKQIDAVYIDNESSKIYIIQGKYYSGDTVDAEPLREVLSSWVQIKDLAHLQEGANEKLQVKIVELANALEDDNVLFF